MASRIRMLIVLLVTLGCLVGVLWGIEVDRVMQALQEIDLWVLPLVVGIQAGVLLLRVFRFQLLLGASRPSFGRQLAVCTIAFMAINVVPFRLGEFVRPYLLTRDGVPWGRSLGAVVMERVIDLFALLTMLMLIGIFVELPEDIVVGGIDVLAAGQRAVGVVFVVLMLGLAVVGAGGNALQGLLEGLPLMGPKLAGFAGAFQAAVRDLLRHPLAGVLAVALGAAIWAGTVAQVYVLLGAFPSVPQGADVALTVTGMTVAGTVAIPTPGFFGPFEVFCKAVLVLWGVHGDVATTFAVVWHIFVFGFHALTGAGFLAREGVSLTSLVRDSRRENTPSRAE